jgi:hypothetical protein
MGTLLAVLVFVAVATVLQIARADDEATSDAAAYGHRRTPDPSPRDLHAVTGTLGNAPVPSWG